MNFSHFQSSISTQANEGNQQLIKVEETIARLVHTIVEKAREFDSDRGSIDNYNELITAMCEMTEQAAHIAFSNPEKPTGLDEFVDLLQPREQSQQSQQSQPDPTTPTQKLLNDNDFEKERRCCLKELNFLNNTYISLKAARDEQNRIIQQQLHQIQSLVWASNTGWNGNTEWRIGSGLVNLEFTCFANATLQVLFHIPLFVRYMLTHSYHAKHCDHQCLDLLHCKLTTILQQTRAHRLHIKTTAFMSLIRQKTPVVVKGKPTNMFPGDIQHDASEFITKLSELMNIETNIFAPIFQFHTRDTVKCNKCSFHSDTIQLVTSIQLPIQRDTSLNILLDDHFGVEDMESKCHKCNNDTTKSSRILQTPVIFALSLKRFNRFNSKVSSHIDVPEKIDFRKYVQPNTPHSTYELVSYINHIGDNLKSGHYTSTIKSQDGNWYLYNDDKISQCIASEEEKQRSQAYMFFYSLVIDLGQDERESFESITPGQTSSAVHTHESSDYAYVDNEIIFPQAKLLSEDQLRQFIQAEFGDVINVMPEFPQTIQHKRCKIDNCPVCIMLKNDPQSWLQRFSIYPMKETTCSSLGTYFMGHTSDAIWYAGSLKCDGHRHRQKRRFAEPEDKFEEGPTKWCFVAFPSTNDYTKDLLLEDILIILTRSCLNRTLNILDSRRQSARKTLLKYLKHKPSFYNIYQSVPFFEWLTKQQYQESTYIAAGNIINNSLPSISMSKVNHNRTTICPQKHILYTKPLKANDVTNTIYDKIKKHGSVTNPHITNGQLYGLHDEQTKTNFWMFQHQATQLFKKCYEQCQFCEIFKNFLSSIFWRMEVVLNCSHEYHLLLVIMKQYIPGVHYTCLGTSRDGKIQTAIHSFTFKKINVTSIQPPVPLPKNSTHHINCKSLMNMFNSRSNMYVSSGMNPCLNVMCNSCSTTGGHQHPLLEQLHLIYQKSITCRHTGVYLMVDKRRNYCEAGSTIRKYSKRMRQKFSNEQDQQHQIRTDWMLFGLARNRVNAVGAVVADYINWITSQGVPAAAIVAIGHSLGAHVVGAAGKRTAQQIQSVVGLDPAGPLFSLDAPADRLHFTDAYYVESIITDAGRLGFQHPIAHGNFYPNWGTSQPGCGIDITGNCGHGLVNDFFAASINNNNYFGATRCTGLQAITNRNCPQSGANGRLGGEPVHNSGTLPAGTVFFLSTTGTYPFAQGPR